MGYNQWQTFYKHYTVIGSKCTATFSTRATAAVYDDNLVAGMRVDDDSSFTGFWQRFAEQPNSKWGFLSSGKTGGRQHLRISKKWSAKRWYSQKNILSDPDLGADFEVDPLKEAFFCLMIGSQDDATNGSLPTASVVIEYIVVLSQLKDFNQS